MARLWQYQQRFEPVLVPAAGPETVTVDKWHPTSAMPPRRRSVIACISPVLAFVSVAPIEAVAPAMAWQQPQSNPVRAVRRAIPSNASLVELVAAAPETVTLDKWFQAPSVPVRRKPWRPIFKTWGAFDANGIRDPNLDDWEPRLPKNPVTRKPRAQPGGLLLVEFGTPVPPTVPDLSWAPKLPTNPPIRRPRVQPGLSVLVEFNVPAPPAIPELSWAPVLPTNPVRREHWQRPGDTVLVDFSVPAPPVLSVFDWFVPTSIPVRRAARPTAFLSILPINDVPIPPDVFAPVKRIWKQPFRKTIWRSGA